MRILSRGLLLAVLLLDTAGAEDTPKDALGDPLPEGAIRRFGTVRLRHRDNATGVAYTPDGTQILSSGRDGLVRIWDARTGRPQGTLCYPGKAPALGDITITRDGQFVVAGTSESFEQSHLCVWNFGSGANVAVLDANKGRIRTVACSANGEVIASGGDDGLAIVFDWTRKCCLHRLDAGGSVFDIAFSPDDKYVAAAAKSGAAEWNLRTGKQRRKFRPPSPESGTPSGIAYSPDGRHVAVTWWKGVIGIYSAQTGRRLRKLEGHDLRIDAVAWSPDGSRLASADFASNVFVWDVETGALLARAQGHGEWFWAIAFAPDGKTLAAASYDVRVFDAESLQQPLALPGHHDQVQALAISDNGKTLASGAGNDPVLLWDLGTGKKTGELPHNNNGITSLGFCPGTGYLAVGYAHRILRVWDTGRAGLLFEKAGAEDQWQYVSCAPDGKQIAWSTGPVIRIVEIPSGTQLRLHYHKRKLTNNWRHGKLRFARDGRLLAYLDDGTVRQWSEGKETIVLRRPPHSHDSPVLSPDGWTVALDGFDAGFYGLGSKGQRRPLAEEPPDEGWRWLSYTPSGAFIVSGASDGTLRIWETATARVCATLSGKQGRVLAACFAPDGRRLATAGEDTTILLWDLASPPGARPPATKAAEVRTLALRLRLKPTEAFLAVGALARTGDLALKPLRKAVMSGKPPVRLRALAALDFMGTPAAQDLLRSVALEHRDKGVRAAAEEIVWRHHRLEH